jgi:hypothetical protein
MREPQSREAQTSPCDLRDKVFNRKSTQEGATFRKENR